MSSETPTLESFLDVLRPKTIPTRSLFSDDSALVLEVNAPLDAPALEAIETANGIRSTDPFNIEVMDIHRFIRDRGILPVTSSFVVEPSSPDFHPNGVFSEIIFGQIGSSERITQFGYIELNTQIIAPVIFKAILKISDFYNEICKGSTYAVWDPVLKNFIRVTGDPTEVEDADTGFSFFMRHYMEMDFALTESYARENRVGIINKYRDRSVYTQYLVLPAGLRDVKIEGSRMVHDDINKLYWTLLAYARKIPKGTTSRHYDPIRYSLQMKAMEIYMYLENIQTGKRGFLQGEYGARRIALGTRSVISAAEYVGLTPDDPQILKPDETKVGLFQSAKALQPVVIHGLKTILVDPVFKSGDSGTIPVIDPETFELTYVEVSSKERAQYTNKEKLEAWLNRFKNKDVRENPVSITGRDGKTYWMQLIYDLGDQIYLCRGLSDLRTFYPEDIDLSKLRALTWVELLYMITANAAEGRHACITRYPVIGSGSSYPSRIHVTTTSPARVVSLKNLVTNDEGKEYPQYPILGAPTLDIVSVHSSALAGLGADLRIFSWYVEKTTVPLTGNCKSALL